MIRPLAAVATMAEVEEAAHPASFRRPAIRTSAKAAIAIQTMFKDAEGMAPCHRPFTTKPAAPTRFIHWKAGERPVSFSAVTSR